MTPAEKLGNPLKFEFRGTVYSINNPICFGVEADFATWVYLDAVDQVERLHAMFRATNGQRGLNARQYDKHMDRLADLLSAGSFKWGSDIVEKRARESWDGIKYLLFLRIQMYHPNVTLQLVEDIFADDEASARLGKILNPQMAVEEKKEEKQPEAPETPTAQGDH